MEHVSYTFEDLYYNIYNKDDKPYRLNQELDDIKFGIYRGNFTEDQLREAAKRKIWLTNSPIGWSQQLDKVLSEHYGI